MLEIYLNVLRVIFILRLIKSALIMPEKMSGWFEIARTIQETSFTQPETIKRLTKTLELAVHRRKSFRPTLSRPKVFVSGFSSDKDLFSS